MKKHILIVSLLSLFSINAMQEQTSHETKNINGEIGNNIIEMIKSQTLTQFDWHSKLPQDMKMAIISFLTYFSSMKDSIRTIKALAGTDKYHHNLLSNVEMTDLLMNKFSENFTLSSFKEAIANYIINIFSNHNALIPKLFTNSYVEFNLSFIFHTQTSAKWLKAKAEKNLALKHAIEKAMFCIIPDLETNEQAEHIIKFFINAGANLDTGYQEKNHGFVDSYFSENDTILHRLMLLEKPNAQIVKRLIKYNVNLNALNSMYHTPLARFILASIFPDNHQITIIDILLKADSNLVNLENNNLLLLSKCFFQRNIFPLRQIVDYEHYEQILKTFLQYKADINARDDNGRTLLMYAIEHPKIVELLLANAANSEIQDNDGLTALNHAEKRLRGNPKSAELKGNISLLQAEALRKNIALNLSIKDN